MNHISNELDILINELNKEHTKYEKLIKQIYRMNKPDIISILTLKRNILDFMPESIISYYEKEILDNYLVICKKCTISNLTLLEKIINKSKTDYSHTKACSESILLNTKLRPEFLYHHFYGYFSPHTILNYSPVPLKESFIFSINRFAKYVNTGFFLIQPITKKILFHINWFSNSSDANRFFDCMKQCIENNEVIIEPNTLVKRKCVNKITIPALIKRYNFTGSTLKYIFNTIQNDTESLEVFFKTQDITKDIFKKPISQQYYHLYLTHNPFCADDTIIKMHKNNPTLNWLYINTNINFSEHIEYCKYLMNCGEQYIVEYNIKKSLENNIKLKNPTKLLELGILEEAIYTYLKQRTSEFEIGIHKKEVRI